jgi:hypothetical protein
MHIDVRKSRKNTNHKLLYHGFGEEEYNEKEKHKKCKAEKKRLKKDE